MTTATRYARNLLLILSAIMAFIIAALIVVSFVFALSGHQGPQHLRQPPKDFTPLAGANTSVDPCEDFHAYACGFPGRPSSSFELRLGSALNASGARMYELTLQQKVESFYQSCTQGMPPPEGAREWFLRFLAGVFPRKSDGGSGGAMLRPLANLSLNFRLHLLLSFRCERGCTNLVLDELDRGHWMDQWHWLHAEPEVHDGFLLDALEQVLESTANLAARANEVKAIERLIKRRLFSHGHNAAEEIEDVVNVSLVDLNNKTPGLPHEPWPEVIGSVLRFHPVLTPVNVTSMRALVSSRAVFDVLNFVSAHVVRDAERELFLRWLVAKQLHVVHFVRLRRGEDELRVHCVRLCAAAMGTALALPLLPELDAAVSRARRVARQVLHVMALRIQSPANVGWLDDDAAEAASSKVVSLRFGVIGASSVNDTAGIERLYSGLGVLGAAFLPNWLKIAQYLSDSPAAADGTLWASGILTTRSRYSREGFHVPLRRIEGPEVKIGTEYADSALADGILGARLMLPAAMAFSAASPSSSWSAVARGQFLWRLRCIHRAYGPSAAVDNVSRIAYISSLEPAHDFFYFGDRQRHLASPATVPSWRRCTRQPTRSTADYSRSQLFYYFWCRETCSFGEPSLCNVPLRNSHRFAEAFGCPPNRSAMNPSEKCAFW